ncbi:MAG: carboxypeptidase-like regulatory domain-containing protein [Prevotellaceae bacterium]|jgi:hypothetical protein|nr:carboxypeptidase-like regulatory domain-containing protein [Prevotellaceae bacterium]
MRNLIILFLFLANHFATYSQESKFILIDSVTKQAIPYAAVLFHSYDNGLYTDSTGVFYASKSEIITLSHLSYCHKTIELSSITDEFIELVPKSYSLNEAIVTPNHKKTLKGKEIGYKNLGTRTKYSGTRGTIIAVYIPNNETNKQQFISKILIELDKEKKDEDGLFRLHLFNAEGWLKPPQSEILFSDKIYPSATQSKKSFSEDVSEFGIIFPKEGIYLGIEWLATADRIMGRPLSTNPFLGLTNKCNENYTWIKNIWSNEWIELKDTDIVKLGKYKYLNAKISIEIIELP